MRYSANVVMFVTAVLLATGASWGAKKKDAEEQARIQDSLKQVEIQNLQREIESLSRIRLQKADSLEKLEAAHWSKRYAESQLTEEHQVETRELDGRYSKLSTDLGRVSEEVQTSKDLTSEAEDGAKAEEDAFEAFNTQVRKTVPRPKKMLSRPSIPRCAFPSTSPWTMWPEITLWAWGSVCLP